MDAFNWTHVLGKIFSFYCQKMNMNIVTDLLQAICHDISVNSNFKPWLGIVKKTAVSISSGLGRSFLTFVCRGYEFSLEAPGSCRELQRGGGGLQSVLHTVHNQELVLLRMRRRHLLVLVCTY